MIDLDFEFTAKLWKWKSGSWHFVTLPKDISQDIKTFTRHNRRGFGSIRVKVSLGETEWLTSIFPDKKSGCYFLPVKAAVRKGEKFQVDDEAKIRISVLV